MSLIKMKKRVNKKAQTWSFIIGGLLAIAILVMGIYLISSGKFGDWFTSGKTNVAAIAFNCNAKCNTGPASVKEYCIDTNDVIFEKGWKSEKYTCKQLEAIPNSGVTQCDKFDCNIEPATCDVLKVFCVGTEKCTVAWMDETTKKAAAADKVKYKEVSDFTSRVTDVADKNAAVVAKTPFCVKTVEI